MNGQTRPIRLAAAAAALVLAAVGAGGCAAERPGWNARRLRTETFTVRGPQTVLRHHDRVAEGPAARTRWWHGRNDARLGMRGRDGRTEVVYYSRHIRDRQDSHGDRIHNDYRRELHTHERGRLIR